MGHIHLIAIGGSVMHNLALALHQAGHTVSGSDDQIFEPARTRLEAAGLLPKAEGWDPERIHSGIDFVILGMHAKAGNAELARTMECRIPVYSFPEFISKAYAGKQQVVVAGSHGKTTTTSMIMHILRVANKSFDYLVGAQLEGFSTMVRLSDAPIAVIEGDEYLSSCLDPRPKFVHYLPDILIITGIAWDHFNVFPTQESYESAFADLIRGCKPGTSLIYACDDPVLTRLVRENGSELECIGYGPAEHGDVGGVPQLVYQGTITPLKVFGRHNLENAQAAILACEQLGVCRGDACRSLGSFHGAAKRLECLYSSEAQTVYRDFAHAPSKLKASLEALRARHVDKKMLAVVELHSYSSLNEQFIPNYAKTSDAADRLIVYYDSKALDIKGMKAPDPEFTKAAFDHPNSMVCRDSVELRSLLKIEFGRYGVVVFAGSGNFGGLHLNEFQPVSLE
ncbi:MAG: hypothetical protein KBF37_03985 [Saprospiraceae bacterium]|jgi:UDP-N-acetylmuramate: L-alanyl-gamma-D-glutamyl-meso-diaminopimelate ligase|nr:hypothetical protein [Saprospiraceae bacterium]MBV6471906.1 UDP-N-acetylmuramate--L-alanyl-gamma-D-glutamyl-meso-2,6-diaminoheptandioate ligase [Saprospiraceae bacterium]